jgi:hypothetical protein
MCIPLKDAFDLQMQMKNDGSRSIQIIDQESKQLHALLILFPNSHNTSASFILCLLVASITAGFQDVPGSRLETLYFGLL